METIVVLSQKKWNSSSIEALSKKFADYNWILISEKADLNYENLKKLSPKFIFIPHWSYIIPDEIFENFECVVFHMTDLPFGRGGSPLQNLISRKIYDTKISALKVVKELDAGPIYAKEPLSLHGTAEEIFIRANAVIEEMIGNILSTGKEPIEQEGEIELFKRRTPEMSNIDGITELQGIFDHIRMLDAEGYPKAFFENEHFKFEFTRASLKSDQTIIADVRISKK